MPEELARRSPAPTSTTRDSLLGAARRRCVRFGPRKTTMDEVAREAGCSRTTLYALFRNMDALYGSPLQQDVEEGALRSIEPGRVSTRQEGTTADAVLCCIDAGHRVAEKALAERSDWEPFASALAQDWEVEP